MTLKETYALNKSTDDIKTMKKLGGLLTVSDYVNAVKRQGQGIDNGIEGYYVPVRDISYKT